MSVSRRRERAGVRRGSRALRSAPTEEGAATAMPERVTLAMLPRVDDWHGWSGSFVGRYRDRGGGSGGQWEFVGVASGAMMDAAGRTQVLSIVRPPEDVVRAFFDGAGEDVPVLVGMPGPLALPPGYHATSSVPVVFADAGDQFVIDVCVAQRAAPRDSQGSTMPRRVLVSIGGCDRGWGWVPVEAVPVEAVKIEPQREGAR